MGYMNVNNEVTVKYGGYFKEYKQSHYINYIKEYAKQWHVVSECKHM